MPAMRIVIDPQAVNDELEREGMLEGSVPIESFLIQRDGAPPNAAVMIVVQLPNGEKVLAKTTLRLLEMAVMAARSSVGPHIDTDKPPH